MTNRQQKKNDILMTGPGQTSTCWDNFCSGMKVSEEWKENFMTQEDFKKTL